MRKLWIAAVLPFLVLGAVAAQTTQELAASSGETLTFELNSGGDIEVIGWDREGAAITTEITGRDADKLQVRVERTADGIKVTTPQQNGRGWRANLKVRAQVPRRFDVKISTMGGDVKLEKLEGSFSGQTMGGDMTFRQLTGNARVSTMGGDIRVSDSELDGKVSTMGGDVLFEDLTGNLDGSTMGGDIIQRNVRRTGGAGGKAVEVKSHGGDVEVDTAPAGANVSTMGGDIHVRSVAEFLKATTMGGDVIVQEASGDVKITTMGGDIEVQSFDGQIEATTMGGDVELNVVGTDAAGGHDIELNSMSGNLTLALPSNFSGRFEIELVNLRKHENKARIDSDFALDIDEPAEWTSGNKRTNGRRYGGDYKIIRASGSVGGGSHLVKLKTINGVIRIERN
ncbi:MAG: DUF4097 family beta strand repeat-containing protein [Acidobacteria bacterium]|nr:DUF4097 family beta strand repeat-containing protein [Acidobacteriota bacterium]